MEEELTIQRGPELGMYASDRELFSRVWRRVMPEPRPSCPIAVDGAPSAPPPLPVPPARPGAGRGSRPDAGAAGLTVGCGIQAQAPGTPAPPAPVPPMDPPAPVPPMDLPAPEPPMDLPAPMPPTDLPAPVPPMDLPAPMPPMDPPAPVPPMDPPAPEPPTDLPAPEPPANAAAVERWPDQGACRQAPESEAPAGDDFPRPDAVPCLGSGSAGHGGQLQEDIRAALEGWQLYRHLARKVTGSAARMLSALASEKHKQARKLAAAHFLISGVRYWPTDRLGTPQTSSWLGTLRRRFALEQQMDSRWRAASLDTRDACLAELYSELAEGCAAHAGVLRALLEQAL